MESGELFHVRTFEEGGRGDGDGLVAGGEHGPAVGAAFGNVEWLAWAKHIQYRQVVNTALGALGESESRQGATNEVAVLDANEMALAVVIRYLQPRQIASARSPNWPLLSPEWATRLAIMPVGSFQLLSGYMNSVPLMCAPSMGKNIGTRGSCMLSEACESRCLIHSVPLPSFGIAGGMGFEMSYLIDFLLFRLN